MKNIWKKYREIVVILAYVLLLGILFYFAIRPLFASISQNIEKIQQGTVEQERRIGKMKEAASLEKQAEIIQKEAENMQVLSGRDQIVTLLELIEKIGEETGNEIKIEVSDETAVKAEKGGKDLISQLPTDKYIKMKITISGKYNNFANFVRKIESMQYWSDIVSLRISASEVELQGKKNNISPFQKVVIESKDKEEKILENAGVVAEAGMVFYLDE